MSDFEYAKDKVLMGVERKSMIVTEEEKRVTAVHEAGHALLAVLLPHADPIHKVTIIPRGMALGLTQQLPVDEKHNYSRLYLNDTIAILLGGRIAEELTTGNITTGAGNDLERATDLARKMVCEWGMSDAMGPLTFGKKEEQIFLGREIAQHQDYSEDTALRIDAEVKRFVMDALRARDPAAQRQQEGAPRHRRRAARARSRSTPNRSKSWPRATRSTTSRRLPARRRRPATRATVPRQGAAADRSAASEAARRRNSASTSAAGRPGRPVAPTRRL